MKIGITTRCIIEDNIKKEFVNEEYLRLLNRFNLTPIIIPYGVDNEEILNLCDGFVIPGGDDIDAKCFMQENNINNVLVPKEVDELDFRVLDYALKNQKPVLGICRGLQVINVFFDGDLIQHIDDNIHKNTNHILEGNPKSRLFDSLNLKEVNSFHHQKIGKLGNNLFVDATSLDAIEVITYQDQFIATQFHIEKKDDDVTKIIMEYFISLFQKDDIK